MKPRFILSGLIAASALFVPLSGFAQFTVSGTVTSTQTLSSGTGTVGSGGTISTGSNLGVNMTGTTTLNNNGTIQTTSGRGIDSNSGTANLTVSNTGLISTNTADAFRVNTSGSSVMLTNSGTIRVTAGGQALDWAAITTGSNRVDNLAAGSITAVGEDAIRPGQNGIINNAGLISATPVVDTGDSSGLTGSDGIDLRVQKTVTVTNTGTITGRHGIATDGANVGPSSLTVNNNAGFITAMNGSGLNVDAATVTLSPSPTGVTANVTNLAGATIQGGVMASATTADGDGIDIDGILTLNNSGNVFGRGAKGANNPEGIAAGGGTITNTATGQIIGFSTATNGESGKIGSGILVDNSDGGNAFAATTVTNSGLIRGETGPAIRIIGTFADTITNNAGGTLRGAGASAIVQTGDGGDTVTNRGAIISEGGNAIDLQAGNDNLIIEGGAASITGNVTGGTGTNTVKLDLGVGNTFNYAGSLSSFATVEVLSGIARLTGTSTYTGVTKLTGGQLILGGNNLLSSSSSLDLEGGSLKIEGTGANGQTFASLTLGDTSLIDLDPTSLTFNDLGAVATGETLSVINYDEAVSPNYAFRFLGNLTADSDFLRLVDSTTINGSDAEYAFDGTYTNVTAAPVPEPSTALFGLSLLGLAIRRRSRRA